MFLIKMKSLSLFCELVVAREKNPSLKTKNQCYGAGIFFYRLPLKKVRLLEAVLIFFFTGSLLIGLTASAPYTFFLPAPSKKARLRRHNNAKNLNCSLNTQRSFKFVDLIFIYCFIHFNHIH